MKKKILIAFLTGLVLLFICIFLSGGGHGYIQFLLFFFPTSLIHKVGGSDALTGFVMALQFPLYTFLYNLGNTGKQRLLIGFILISIHLFVSFLAISNFLQAK